MGYKLRRDKLKHVTPDLTADTDIEPIKQPPSIAGMTTKVVKGSLWTLAGQVAPLAVSLFTTPFVIRMLGAESYGVLIILGLIPTYLGFADFGMSIASTKFASEAYAEGDTEKEARIVRTAALIALCSSLPFAIALFALSDWLVTFFNVPEHLLGEAALALKIASITFVVNFLNSIFNTPQLTRLRMDLNTFVTSGFRILGLIATPVVLYLGFGILGAVGVLMVASLLTMVGHFFMSDRLLPTLLGSSLDRSIVRPMMSFGATILFASVAAVLLANLEKLILPGMTSVVAFAYYSVAFTLANTMTLFSNSMSQSLVPAFSRLFARGELDHVQSLYSRAMRFNLIFFAPYAMIFMVLARPFFTVWAGAEFGDGSTEPFYVLLLGLMFNFSATVAGAIMIAAHRTKVSAVLYWIELIPYLILAAVMTHYWGALGAALAWGLRVSVDSFALIIIVRKLVGVRFQLGINLSYFLIAGLFLAGAPLLALARAEYFLIIIVGGIGLLFYSIVAWLKLVLPSERALIANKFNSLRGSVFNF